jgi:hypothetical protein
MGQQWHNLESHYHRLLGFPITYADIREATLCITRRRRVNMELRHFRYFKRYLAKTLPTLPTVNSDF